MRKSSIFIKKYFDQNLQQELKCCYDAALFWSLVTSIYYVQSAQVSSLWAHATFIFAHRGEKL